MLGGTGTWHQKGRSVQRRVKQPGARPSFGAETPVCVVCVVCVLCVLSVLCVVCESVNCFRQN